MRKTTSTRPTTSATITLLVFQIGILVCAVLNLGWLVRENGRKERVRESGAEARPEHEGTMPNESAYFKYVL